MKIVDLTGQVFSRLTVLRLSGSSRGGSKLWECNCSCGNICHVSTRHLNRKNCKIKSCGCLKKERNLLKGKYHPDFKGYEGITSSFWTSHIIRSAKGDFKTNRKETPLEIDIKYGWDLYLKQDKKCALSGLIIRFPEKHTDTTQTCSLDRIDSSKGYIPGNVQWVHKHINIMKNKFSQEHFIEMCKLVAKRSQNIEIK
jgi:hypothetical protein